MTIGLFAVIVISGCSTDKKKDVDYANNLNLSGTLKVMMNDGATFMWLYGNLFQMQNPKLHLEFVELPATGLEDAIKQEMPDVLALDLTQYEELANDGRLYDLTSLIANDHFDIKGIHQGIVGMLKSKGGDRLYGLSPTFSNTAIYYNKDLFDKRGVPYPSDQMTWDEVLKLAHRLAGQDQPEFGMYVGSFSDAVENIANSQGLSMIDPDTMKVTANTDSFKQIFETIAEAYRSKALEPLVAAPSPGADTASYDPFMKGQCAMKYDYYSFIGSNLQRLGNAQSNAPINWDVVTAPADPADRSLSSSYQLARIFTVNSEAGNSKAAWELVKFLNSDQMAQAKSRDSFFEPLSRTKYINNPEGKHLEAFYMQTPNADLPANDDALLPEGFMGTLHQLINEEGNLLIERKKTVDEVLSTIQQKAQAALDKDARISGVHNK